nr:hypothetical protein [Methanobrevibacter arboriphilus]
MLAKIFDPRMDIEQTMGLVRSTQSIDSVTEREVMPINYGKESLNKLRLKAPLLEFLEAHGSVNDDSSTTRHQFETHRLTTNGGLTNEYGTENESNEEIINEVYGDYDTAVIHLPVVKTSSLFNYTAKGSQVNSRTREEQVRKLQAVINRTIYTADGAYAEKKFDGLFKKASNVIDMKGATANVNTLNDGIQEVIDNHGNPNLILGTGRAVRQIIDSDNAKKVYQAKEPITLGSWGNVMQSIAGMTPILVDTAINNFNIGENTGDTAIVLDTTSYEMRFVLRQFFKQVPVSELGEAYKFASFVAACLKVPEWVTIIKNIGLDEGNSFLNTTVINAATEKPIEGAKVEVTANSVKQEGITNRFGKTNVAYLNGHNLTLNVSAEGFTPYTETINKQDIDGTAPVQLVPQ